MRKVTNILLTGGVVLLSFLLIGMMAGMWTVNRLFEKELPQVYLETGNSNQPSILYGMVYDRHEGVSVSGKTESQFVEVAKLQGSSFSIPVEIGDVPQHLIHAFVAIEDKRFFEHGGVDWLRTGEAALEYLFGNGSFGASTLTQQLVKNLTGNDSYSLKRKVQEMFYAVDLESKLEKPEILERYLNIINLSGGCRGVGAAAKRYFSKSVEELSLCECATLAAITQNPSKYDPVRHPENTLKRRNTVLSEMQRLGYLTEEDCKKAVEQPLGLQLSSVSVSAEAQNRINSWYTDTVMEDVRQDLMKQYGYSSKTASELLYYGGLRIYTPMDAELQELLEAYFREDSHFPACSDGRIPQASAVLLNPSNGDLLAVAGSRGEKQGNRIQNFATQTLRPPASALKPLSVYAPALKYGVINWASVYDDVPVDFIGGSTPWPKNADGVWRGLTGIPDAVAYSVNTVAVRVLRELGSEKSLSFLYSLGLSGFGEGNGDAALALGQMSYGLTLRDLTAAYTVFSDGGLAHRARSYYLVTDRNGKILLSAPAESSRLLTEEQAAIMTKLLQGVTEYGTAKALNVTDRTEVAGKTGTSSSDFDRWFVGYTPEYLCGVWYGFEYPEKPEGVRGNPAVTIWDGLMQEILENRGCQHSQFETPRSLLKLTYCADSGELVTDACMDDPRGTRRRTGWFLPGTQPHVSCPIHRYVNVETEQGGVLQNGTGIRVGLLELSRSFPIPLQIRDAQYSYQVLPETVSFSTDPNQPFFIAQYQNGSYPGTSSSVRQYNCGVSQSETYPDPEKDSFPNTETE